MFTRAFSTFAGDEANPKMVLVSGTSWPFDGQKATSLRELRDLYFAGVLFFPGRIDAEGSRFRLEWACFVGEIHPRE